MYRPKHLVVIQLLETQIDQAPMLNGKLSNVWKTVTYEKLY